MYFQDAVDWFQEMLRYGPRDASELNAEAKAVGCSLPQLGRVRRHLKAVMTRRGWGSSCVTQWSLPANTWEGSADSRAAAMLTRELEAAGRVGDRDDWPLERVVGWVSERLLRPIGHIKVEEIPCGRALAMLSWAKANQDDFRKLYEAKLVRRGISGKESPKRGSGNGRSVVGGGQRETLDRLLNRPPGVGIVKEAS